MLKMWIIFHNILLYNKCSNKIYLNLTHRKVQTRFYIHEENKSVVWQFKNGLITVDACDVAVMGFRVLLCSRYGWLFTNAMKL